MLAKGRLVFRMAYFGPHCEGMSCGRNIRIALPAEEIDERLYTTSPCVLE